MEQAFYEETAAVFLVIPLIAKIDDQRINGKTKEIKEEADALCGGFEGDILMEINVAVYRLAKKVPLSIWQEYDGQDMTALADRIKEERGLPAGFLAEWKSFMDKYGFDGQDQLFVGCPRYKDIPEFLLQKMKLTAMGDAKDPSVHAKLMLEKRRAVMTKQEEEAKREAADPSSWFWTKRKKKKKLAEIQQRNEILDHLFWLRNSPKLHMTEVVGAIRTKALKIEEKLIAEGRLEEKGDIFHLKVEEVDRYDGSSDLMELVRPRKAVYQRFLAQNTCPILVDSRCRILKLDPPEASDDPGKLVGFAISPGVATGKVRIIKDLSDEQTRGFGIGPNGQKEDHVLCAVVTGPAWTPLFANASAVVLQIGGALQHGALCAREYGKPAVSNIDVYNVLKDGMTVSVDGNTGVVTILDDGVSNGVANVVGAEEC